jgi:hypothetical protein
MDFDFNGIKEVIEEFDIPEPEYERLSKLFNDEGYETMDDFLADDTFYIAFSAWNFDDGYLRLCRIGALKCLEILNKGYREPFQHWLNFELFEKELQDEFYEFKFKNSYSREETIFIYPLYN